MAGFSRRTFLIRGSLGAAAAAVASALPGLPSLATTATEDAPAAEDTAPAVADDLSVTSEPVIAHITDLRAGQLSVFVGEHEYAVVDRALASRLLQVTK
jgi:hypothetical protein